MGWSPWVDLQCADDEFPGVVAGNMPFDLPRPDKKRFPPGMTLRLDEKTMEKMELDCADCKEGDIIDLRAFATVTVVHDEQGNKYVCLQVEKIRMENEDSEGED